MRRFYCDMHLPINGQVQLPLAVVQHLHVLRAKPNQAVILFNGNGNHYLATLTTIKKREITATINQHHFVDSESSLKTHLGLAISKGDRFDRAIQQATELGVSAITPLLSDYCDVKLSSERLQKRMAHWQQVIISACEQASRSILPTLNDVCELQQWLTAAPSSSLFLVLSPHTNQTLDTIKQSYPAIESLTILVGPEGGLSSSEILLAEQHHYQSIKLGDRIMRTETAPTAMLALAQLMWGDF